MALTAQLSVLGIPGLCPPVRSKSARLSTFQSSALLRRKDVAEKLHHCGSLRTSSRIGRKQREWVLQASSEKEIISNEEKPVASDSSPGAKDVENSSGPPVLTIIAGLVVMLGVLWAVSSIVQWIVSLFIR
ncbi:hypothetical protein MPTK1_3g13960 [Marchantia polymorpha subsp. ruderalis]|uniref:Uncharacterized protein n=2 Tax=Marchantia polymorpha TaxID=3197 RepID=A0A176VWM2_MARPO|nr:hypothetical protein AXG93_2601s1030 [Marchantia polymorpha subsp. ruderalis]PTQ49048.1 hypothetical protein MARPO_0004s0275 [Marchantia polymorpha]BBN05536.1 hypothetical protein Mp_3g13960 [Marchantia polymorpha subsp. ruderalis]|eukprot:PTQ49048.1 hypothetical protein MARPO_0004s0275 [Marchantia polymorpha]